MRPPEKTADQIRAGYESIDERDLVFGLGPWRYKGRRIRLSGQVTNISRGDDGTWLTLRVGSFPCWVTVVVRYAQSLPELQKDMTATVYGLCAGTERVRYESDNFLGLTVNRPLIRAEHVER